MKKDPRTEPSVRSQREEDKHSKETEGEASEFAQNQKRVVSREKKVFPVSNSADRSLDLAK